MKRQYSTLIENHLICLSKTQNESVHCANIKYQIYPHLKRCKAMHRNGHKQHIWPTLFAQNIKHVFHPQFIISVCCFVSLPHRNTELLVRHQSSLGAAIEWTMFPPHYTNQQLEITYNKQN